MGKFMLSKKTTEFDEIFTVDLTLCGKCQINSEDFVNFCNLLRNYELYVKSNCFRSFLGGDLKINWPLGLEDYL